MDKLSIIKLTRILWRCLIASIVLIAVVIGLLQLGKMGLYRCPIQLLTGFQCASCGITRAAFAILRFDFFGALLLNPMIYPIVAYTVMMILAWAAEWKKILYFKWPIYVLAALFFLLWVARLWGYMQGVYPEFYSSSGLLERLTAYFM